jgi:hypothetical protein
LSHVAFHVVGVGKREGSELNVEKGQLLLERLNLRIPLLYISATMNGCNFIPTAVVKSVVTSKEYNANDTYTSCSFPTHVRRVCDCHLV